MAPSHLTLRVADGAYKLTENLLSKAHYTYDVVYQGYLANHLPHGLYTLCALGASTERIQEFHDRYVQRLEPKRKANTIIDSSNWTEHIGNKNFYSDYLRFFDEEVNSKGMKATFDLYFNQLMGESLGAALHPLIDIGYAMEFSNPMLLSEGLSYTCMSPLQDTSKILEDGESIQSSADLKIVDLLKELQAIHLPGLRKEKGNFSSKTKFLLQNHWMVFKDLIAKWDLSRSDELNAKLNELTEASILGVFATYPQNIDFFLVHGLTGNHAVRILFSNLPEDMQRKVLKVNLLGLLTDYVVQGSPEIDVNVITGYKEADQEESWENILERTIATDEEHVLKVVRSLIYYMEKVPAAKRSELFTEKFLKKCALKMVDIIHLVGDYRFD
ncbi:Oxidoreductase AflY [Pseudolycoriella hygida]|uniref:Oxidoreductase AflY n=1 Tax=Pseudolycoriella hygida TaxID=35572 RepID=A0A9Q0N1S3_9DIPT|nr:Oxidoreductase AflY [Pseudolycoriella hygida]